ncbi:hypothetical protein ACTFIZ_008110 [Dictyostelium cf. discoideum]
MSQFAFPHTPDTTFSYFLEQGSSLLSTAWSTLKDKNSKYCLVACLDGDVTISSVDDPNSLLWSTKTNKGTDYGPYQLSLGLDGVLSLFDKYLQVVWHSVNPSDPNGGPYCAQLNANGQLVILNGKRHVIWFSITNPLARPNLPYHWSYGYLSKNDPWSFTLQQGQILDTFFTPQKNVLYDKTGLVSLVLQEDGNAVVYKRNENGNKVLWETNSNVGSSYKPFILNMKPDGNLVLLTKLKKIIWQSLSTSHGVNGLYFLELKTNGQLLVKDKFREIIWFSVNKSNLFSPDLDSDEIII